LSSLKVLVPPEFAKLQHESELFFGLPSSYSKDGIFRWVLSNSHEAKRRLWPFYSRSNDLSRTNLVLSWSRDESEIVSDSSVRFYPWIRSQVCTKPKTTTCMKTDPPCSEFGTTPLSGFHFEF
jgi:hypothetical protein